MTRRAGALMLAVGVLGGYLGLSQTCPTVAVQVLDLATAEFKAHAITVNVAGIEIFGFRFGASPQDIARAVAKEIAGRVCRGGGSGSNGIQA